MMFPRDFETRAVDGEAILAIWVVIDGLMHGLQECLTRAHIAAFCEVKSLQQIDTNTFAPATP